MANRKWHSHPVILMAIAINVFLLGLTLAWSDDQHALGRVLVEDGIVEWMQFLAFTATAAMLGFVFVERRGQPGTSKFELLVLAGLTALVALAALEEISWFQRVLNVTSSEFFLQNNRQAETNLHNLAVGSGSLHKNVLLKLIVIAGLTHNLILPFLARKRPGLQRWVEQMGLYLPPLGASIVYVTLVALSHLLVEHPRKGELGETFGAMHYMATVFYAYFVGHNYGKPAMFEEGVANRRIAVLFAMAMLFLLLAGWMLSAGVGAVGYS
ncbi:hypothetical protein [Massilia niabensis]|uniref:Uncharacterized protein n=1 Tax=Massilia niabensis TaxID=544910 RepID=A0ABW0L480_9BURK